MARAAAGRVTMRAGGRRARRSFRVLRRVAAAAAVIAALASASARAEDCGHGPEGFGPWLTSFKQVAQGNGVSATAVDRALAGVAYDPAVKRHDGGVAMFGHNFAGFAASHVTPGMVARGRAELKRYAEPLKTIERRFGVPGPVVVAIWGQETSFGGDSGSFPTYSALATLAWDCRRAERYRAELVDALMLVERGIVQNPRELRGAWAGEIGQTQLMPSAYLMFATTPDGTGTPDLIHNSADALASTAAFLKGHGWQPGQGWDEGEPNFAAILQWNSAEIYAKTVALFADRLAGR
jgi:lytic murein transglycosylase